MTKEETEKLCSSIIDKYPACVSMYKLGKTGLIGFFVGEVWKESKGKASPKEVITVLERLLE